MIAETCKRLELDMLEIVVGSRLLFQGAGICFRDVGLSYESDDELVWLLCAQWIYPDRHPGMNYHRFLRCAELSYIYVYIYIYMLSLCFIPFWCICTVRIRSEKHRYVCSTGHGGTACCFPISRKTN